VKIISYFVTPGVEPTLQALQRFKLLITLLLPVFGKPETHTHTHTHTHTYMYVLSSFSRQCIVRIHDTNSQLTWKSHSPHTHRGTFRPSLTPAQTLYLQYMSDAKTSPNLKVVNRRRHLLTSASPVHRLWPMKSTIRCCNRSCLMTSYATASRSIIKAHYGNQAICRYRVWAGVRVGQKVFW